MNKSKKLFNIWCSLKSKKEKIAVLKSLKRKYKYTINNDNYFIFKTIHIMNS